MAIDNLATLFSAWQRATGDFGLGVMVDTLGTDLAPKMLGRSLSIMVDEPATAGLLQHIPSETTLRERFFLYNFIAQVWSGDSHVLEVGPFLGGTTRALALGMLANPRRHPATTLKTYDRFDNYYQPHAFLEFLQPLFLANELGEEARQLILRSSSFEDIFTMIHQKHEYFRIVEAFKNPLPDTPEEARRNEDLFCLEPDCEYAVFFVDGCKSWYGTKYFMREVAPAARPGSYFIFQDYAWYTCFWLPTFLYQFSDRFKLVAAVDNTYTFRLEAPFSAHEVEARYPDQPVDLGREGFETIFAGLASQAVLRDDAYHLLATKLQEVGALAYIGEKELARAKLDAIDAFKSFDGVHGALIRQARRTPTYSPEGAIEL